MTSIIKDMYIARKQIVPDTSMDANDMKDIRTMWYWGYASRPQNVPAGAGYLFDISTGWGHLQICGAYNDLTLYVRYFYENWGAWKKVTLTNP